MPFVPPYIDTETPSYSREVSVDGYKRISLLNNERAAERLQISIKLGNLPPQKSKLNREFGIPRLFLGYYRELSANAISEQKIIEFEQQNLAIKLNYWLPEISMHSAWIRSAFLLDEGTDAGQDQALWEYLSNQSEFRQKMIPTQEIEIALLAGCLATVRIQAWQVGLISDQYFPEDNAKDQSPENYPSPDEQGILATPTFEQAAIGQGFFAPSQLDQKAREAGYILASECAVLNPPPIPNGGGVWVLSFRGQKNGNFGMEYNSYSILAPSSTQNAIPLGGNFSTTSLQPYYSYSLSSASAYLPNADKDSTAVYAKTSDGQGFTRNGQPSYVDVTYTIIESKAEYVALP